MSICNQTSTTSYQECNCSTIYFTTLPSSDYTTFLSIASSVYDNKITGYSNLNLLPIAQNKKVDYLKCDSFIRDPRYAAATFISQNFLPALDGDTSNTPIVPIAIMHVRCLEDIWESPFGNPFSTASQTFVSEFMRGGTVLPVSLWNSLATAITPSWVFGGGNTQSDIRAMMWYWLVPNTPGLVDPSASVLTSKKLNTIQPAGFPYTMFSYDSLEFSSNCPLYDYAFLTDTTETEGNRHYYQIATGVDTGIITPAVNNDNTFWIRSVPEASSGSLYIKWPSFTVNNGGNTEILMKTNFPAFYTTMTTLPNVTNVFVEPTWIMRIGLEYLSRPNDTGNFLFWPIFMRPFLINVYSQYLDIKTRLTYVTLYQILSSRYINGVNYNTSNGAVNATPASTLYLSQYSSPIMEVPNLTNLTYSLRATVPFLSDGVDLNSAFAESKYPLPVSQNFTLTTVFTGTEIGVSYTTPVHSATSLKFVNPNINPALFGNINLYVQPAGGFPPTPVGNLVDLVTLFGTDGQAASYPSPNPTIELEIAPFPVVDPEVTSVPSTNKSIFDVLNSYILLYILIGIIVVIVVIATIVYFVRRNKVNLSIVPKEYKRGVYGHLTYEEAP